MPSCTSSDSLSRVWPSNESIHAGSSGLQSPSSPNSLTPTSTSPENTLRKRRLRRSTSFQEPFVIQSECRDSRSQSPIDFQHAPEVQDETFDTLSGWIGWYPCFLLRIAKAILLALLPKTWRQLVFALPMLWLSMWLWVVTQLVNLPFTFFRIVLALILTPSAERVRSKRTVVISGGSTIQALHLARNFYSAGARVVVCEVDGLFALARFSTAVSKFYTVPRPTSGQQQNYVRALCDIVDREQAVYYVPVSSTTSAYYDAVAKPHLELLGCTCFCPGIKEVWALDDTLEMLKRCQKHAIPTPNYYAITSKEGVYQLYDTGAIRSGRHVMTTAGPSGLRERSKLVLPASRSELTLRGEISEQKPWVIVQDVEGDHYLTCTTVKESHVIANVTCKMDKAQNGLVPVENKEVSAWLEHFFSKLHLLRPVTGHISFRFVIPKDTNVIVPLSSRVGVSLPYICYTNVHPRLLWKPCKHFNRQNSGPIVVENGRYWMADRNPSLETVTRLIGTVVDKREALFAIWDPLPYCAYYHMLLPFKNMLGFMQRRQDSFPVPLTNPVR